MTLGKPLLKELAEDMKSEIVLPVLNTALIAAILFVIFEMSFASMVYSGRLSEFATRGAGGLLAGGCLLCLLSSLTSTNRSTITIPQDAPAAIMATAAISISNLLGDQAPLEVHWITVAATASLSALVTGTVYIAVGRFRLASLLRFIPFPVVGGFLAGTGWLFVVGSLSVMGGESVSISTLMQWFRAEMLPKWVPGVVFGLVLFLTTQRVTHMWILPGFLAAGVILFYAVFAVYGISPSTARAAGLLVSGVPSEGLWPPFTLKELSWIDWPAVFRQVPTVLAVAMISVMGMLLNTSGIELAVGEEMDLNEECVSGGIANCFAALGGCFPGYPTIALSLLGVKVGARSRWTGITTALLIAGVLFFGGRLLEYFPKALLGGMILFLGCSLIHEWIVQGRRLLPLPDYLIVCAIFLTVGLVGFLQGVALGLFAAVVFFVVRFSKVSVIKTEFSALDRRSIKDRPIPHRKILEERGDRIKGFELTGYIFFGSSTTLMNTLKKMLTPEHRPDAILLDFAEVSGFDISAVVNFRRFVLLAASMNVRLVFTAASDRLVESLKRQLPQPILNQSLFFPHINQGLDWCEERLIEETLSEDEHREAIRERLFQESVEELLTHLERQERFEILVERMRPWLNVQQLPAGTTILQPEAICPGLYLLLSGKATEFDPQKEIPLRNLGQGAVLAAQAAFQPSSVKTVFIADTDCETALLTLEKRRRLEQEDPELALAFHGYLVQSCCN